MNKKLNSTFNVYTKTLLSVNKIAQYASEAFNSSAISIHQYL